MNHTKDEIQISITKKDRIYLSIILLLICIVAIVCILVPRYYELQNNTPTPPSSSETGSGGPNNSDPANTDKPSQQPDTSVNTAYQNSYTTFVLNQLKPLGMPYSTLANYLDSFNILDVIGLNINSTQLENLEDLSQPIYETLINYVNNGTQITNALINSNDLLHSQIVTLSNAFTLIVQR